MSSVTQIFGEASQLADDELDSLLVRLQALKGAAGSSFKPQALDTANEMYKCISEAVLKTRRVRIMPVNVFRNKKGWKEFVQAAEEAEMFIVSLESDRVKKLALRKWICNLVVKYLEEAGRRYAFTWGLLNVQEIVDSYFPGYIESGLMPLVLEKLYAGSTKKLVSSKLL